MSKFRQHPTLPQGFSDTFEERFWRRVNKNGPVPSHCPELGPCWLWTGGIFGHGYGEISAGSRTARPVHIGAHIASWIIHFGLIPDGLRVLHKCDNMPCVRPHHLWIGTAADNSQDMKLKGRAREAKGLKNSMVKLNETQVVAIRSLYLEGHCTHRSLAKRFGVGPTAIHGILSRTAWQHI